MKKTFNIAMTSLLCVMPIITTDLQPVLRDTTISQDDQNEHEVIVEGNASYGNKPIIGKACVVTNSRQLKKKKVGKGDIVIAPAIHSTWYPELMDVNGLIVEKGDDTSHAIALGKKLDIPVIVGASDATKKIIDGQTIACDPITRNVYHIAYGDPKEVHFDTLVMPVKNIYQILPEKLGKPARIPSSQKINVLPSDSEPDIFTQNSFIPAQNSFVPEKKSKMITKAHKIYSSDLNTFKKYVTDMQKTVNGFLKMPFGVGESIMVTGAKATCGPFSAACAPLSFPLFKRSEEYITNLMASLEDCIEEIVPLIKECSKKPGDLDWAARVCHTAHMNAIHSDLPEGSKKEELIDHPEKCRDIDKKIDKKNREEFIKKQEKLTLMGLYARFCVEKNKTAPWLSVKEDTF